MGRGEGPLRAGGRGDRLRLLLYAAPGAAAFGEPVARGLAEGLPGLGVEPPQTKMPPESAFDTWRHQYFAPDLLARLGRPAPGLWIVDRDCYAEGMNFVFGLARAGTGAVVSAARLPDAAMVVKESLHEVGHVLGLRHCEEACVMRFSNTLADALEKPATFCPRCREGARDALEDGARNP